LFPSPGSRVSGGNHGFTGALIHPFTRPIVASLPYFAPTPSAFGSANAATAHATNGLASTNANVRVCGVPAVLAPPANADADALLPRTPPARAPPRADDISASRASTAARNAPTSASPVLLDRSGCALFATRTNASRISRALAVGPTPSVALCRASASDPEGIRRSVDEHRDRFSRFSRARAIPIALDARTPSTSHDPSVQTVPTRATDPLARAVVGRRETNENEMKTMK